MPVDSKFIEGLMRLRLNSDFKAVMDELTIMRTKAGDVAIYTDPDNREIAVGRVRGIDEIIKLLETRR